MKTKTHLPCKKCGSSDALSIQKNGWQKCFSCGTNFPPEGDDNDNDAEVRQEESRPSPFSPLSPVARPFTARGLQRETIERYKVDVGNDSASYEAKYPMFNVEGQHVGNKIRSPNKRFAYEGSARNLGLFGRHAFPPGSAKAITVCEGQDDAMAAFQLLGSKYPAVSVHSASTAVRDCKADFEYLNSFPTIVFCFDNDEAGKKAASEVANIGFPLGKVKIMTLRKGKDPNDYVLSKETSFVKEWWDAPEHKPDGLVLAKDMLVDILNRPQHFSVPYPWPSLNNMTYGIRLSEAVLLMAETGSGKTSILKEIEYSLLRNPEIKEKGYGVGFLHLEEPNYDTALGLLSIHTNKPLHLPDTYKTPEEISSAHAEVFGDSRAILYDSFGSNKIDVIIDKVRNMVALGCRYVFIDHLSIIVSDQSGDERKELDEISTKLKTMTIELDIAVFCVIHINRQGTARGSAGPEQVANIHMSLHRDRKDRNEWRRNVSKIVIEKNRFSGKTGPCLWVWYNPSTGRLSELSEEHIDIYERGDALTDDQIPF